MNQQIVSATTICFIEDPENYLQNFLRSLDIRESSKNTYKRQLKEFFSWIKGLALKNITRENLLDYREYLKNQRELAAHTIGGYLTSIRRFFEWLEAMKIYPNIAAGIKGPKKRHGFKKDSLSIEQIKKLSESINRSTLDGMRDFALINLMIRTGLRTIEIIRATKEDVTINQGEYVLWIHGKGRDSKDEFVLLTQSTLVPIRDYILARGSTNEGAPIFASHSTKNFGKRLTTRSVSRIVKNRLRAIGIIDNRLTAHSLRHTAITLSLLAGSTPQEARALARHTDINTTLVYAHNINRILHAPEKKIDKILGE